MKSELKTKLLELMGPIPDIDKIMSVLEKSEKECLGKGMSAESTEEVLIAVATVVGPFRDSVVAAFQ